MILAHLTLELGLLVNYKVVALDWTSDPKVIPTILTDVQAGILIQIGLGFDANFLDSLL